MPNFATASSGLDLPENILEATGEYVSPERAAQHTYEAQVIRKVIKDIDPLLDLVFAPPGSKAFPVVPRWYFVRRREHANDAYWMIADENGYCAPDMRHVDRLREFDSHNNPNLWKKFERQRQERKAKADKELAEKGREFREKLLERLAHNHDRPISTSGLSESVEKKLWVP